MSKLSIAGLQKLTLLDYPQKTAASVFFAGCNLRCPYCHNADLVLSRDIQLLDEENFFHFLDSRKGLLEGVCISGGEPLLQQNLERFCIKIKERSLSVKLDTNGTLPHQLFSLVSKKLVDYVALDFKHCFKRYYQAVGISNFDTLPVEESVHFLLEGSVPYEFRTTLVSGMHDKESLYDMASYLSQAQAWYLQSFVDSPQVLCGQGKLRPFSKNDLIELHKDLADICSHVYLRGLD